MGTNVTVKGRKRKNIFFRSKNYKTYFQIKTRINVAIHKMDKPKKVELKTYFYFASLCLRDLVKPPDMENYIPDYICETSTGLVGDSTPYVT